MIELTVNAIVPMIMMLSIESAIVGAEVNGLYVLIISGRVNIKANIPSVSVNLLLILSDEFSNMNIAPSKKNMAIRGIITIEIE